MEEIKDISELVQFALNQLGEVFEVMMEGDFSTTLPHNDTFMVMIHILMGTYSGFLFSYFLAV